jgi:DNA-binding transcriptional MerR regulator
VLKIGQVAEQANVSVDTVRFYERRGVLPTPERLASGYRIYTHAAVERIHLTRHLQELGFTLDEVIDALHATDRGDTSCESERWRMEAVLQRIEAKMAELRVLRRQIHNVMAACDKGACVFADTTVPTSPQTRS